jgi:indole-3-glycerol phosphate synthase
LQNQNTSAGWRSHGLMSILDTIVAHKKTEIQSAKKNVSYTSLEESEYFHRDVLYFRDFLLDPDRTGIIAEFKRKSPSKGIINDKVSVEDVTKGYAAAGASALSVLTDRQFFMGRKIDLVRARRNNQIPILRKDFMIDEYQVIEAKALGADRSDIDAGTNTAIIIIG